MPQILILYWWEKEIQVAWWCWCLSPTTTTENSLFSVCCISWKSCTFSTCVFHVLQFIIIMNRCKYSTYTVGLYCLLALVEWTFSRLMCWYKSATSSTGLLLPAPTEASYNKRAITKTLDTTWAWAESEACCAESDYERWQCGSQRASFLFCSISTMMLWRWPICTIICQLNSL